jgi:pimeloyl-ACP methyl ester carboxylesterase
VAGGAWSWEPQVEALRGDFFCAAWEGRGHGGAARVHDAGLAEYSVDANEALDEVLRGRQGGAFIAGHSMGGLLALALAAERPSGVAGLFLVEPVYNPSGLPHGAGLLAPVARIAIAPLVHSVNNNGAFSQTLARIMFEKAFEDRDAMERYWIMQKTQVPLEFPKMFYEAFEGTSGFPNRAFAHEVLAPVTLVEGTAAKYSPRFPELVSGLKEKIGERFRYEMVPGGHYLQLDRPRRVNELLRDLLDGTP